MSKPYQTETYEDIIDTKEYLDLVQENFNQIGTVSSQTTGTLGSGTVFGIFNISNKSNFINYSNGIFTISKSGYYTVSFSATSYTFTDTDTVNTIISIKKNNNIIEKIYPVLPNYEIIPLGSGLNAVNVNFESSIFYVNSNEEIKTEITIGFDTAGSGKTTPFFINCKLNIKEI